MVEFVEYKNKVLDFFTECISFANQYEFEKQKGAMEQARQRIEENKLVMVAVGEARRGKSTLLSAFLEDDGVFPVDIEVTTCLTTSVSYEEKEKITVTFEDNSKKEITRSEIQNYATEKLNENNHKQAKWIEVGLPNPKLKNGLVIVDTPGVGSLNPLHTEVTYSFLPRADIILFISDATSPLTDSELVFLNGIKKYCNNFLFLLTKKDMNAEYQEIINANVSKIEEFAKIPREKVHYIPVSGTMRLASIQNKSERMAKSSNFYVLEKTIWDMISKNRANIIIAPPLGELASSLREIDHEIKIRMAALQGSDSERSELKESLLLQKQRQKLLSDSNVWQMNMQREIDNIAFEQNQMMVEFRTKATEAVEKGLENAQMVGNPELLLNEIILMATTTAHEISEKIYNRICVFISDFREETKVTIEEEEFKNQLDVEDDPVIVFEKEKVLDKLISDGRKIAYNSAGGGMAGGVVGGIAGTVIGFIAGGPAGAILGLQYGAYIGGGSGSVVGGARGAFLALKNPNQEAVPKIKATLLKYVNQTVSNWQLNQPKYIKDVAYKLNVSLREGIKENITQLENDISRLQDMASLNEQKRVEEQKKLTLAITTFKKLVNSLGELKKYQPIEKESSVKEEQSCKTNTVKDEKVKSKAGFTHLED